MDKDDPKNSASPTALAGFSFPPKPIFTINSNWTLDADWETIERIATTCMERPVGLGLAQHEFMCVAVYLAYRKGIDDHDQNTIIMGGHPADRRH